MQTVRIYRLKDIDQRIRGRLKATQMEAARVWMYCVGRHRAARSERTGWPSRDDLQRETKGEMFSLRSQSIQQFLANVETIRQLCPGNPGHRYPFGRDPHKGTHAVVEFCQHAGMQTLYVGDPHGTS